MFIFLYALEAVRINIFGYRRARMEEDSRQ
jgi:hypothetical protein